MGDGEALSHLPTRLRNTAAVTGMRGSSWSAAAVVALGSARHPASAAPVTSLVQHQRRRSPRRALGIEGARNSARHTTTKERGRAEVRASCVSRHARCRTGGAEHIVVALAEIASFARKMTEPRALALIRRAEGERRLLPKHYAPAPTRPTSPTPTASSTGTSRGRCFRFHPLANFGALNARVAAGDIEGSQRLADALVARGVYQRRGGIGWEYTFPYVGRPGAVALRDGAGGRSAGARPRRGTRACRVVVADGQGARRVSGDPGSACSRRSPPGRGSVSTPFTSLPVLNAQLQAVISLQSYATEADDSVAAALAMRMQRAAAATLPRFDTGYWSYYALPHDPSPLDYHEYVVQLLQRLKSADPRFADAAVRFAAYEKQPPAFQLAPGSLGDLTFWLSKPSTVSVVTGAGPSRRVTVDGGWHTLSWGVPKRAGAYPVHLTATDSAGNRATFDALPIVRATSTVAKRATQSAGEATPAADTTVVPGRRDPHRPGTIGACSACRPAPRSRQRHLAGGRDRPGPRARRCAAADGACRHGRGTDCVAATGRRRGRAALAQYAAALVPYVPTLHAIVLAPAPSAADTTGYATAFDAIRAALPDAQLGVAVDGAGDPAGAVGGIAGIDANLVAFHPAASPGKGLWTLADLSQFQDAFPDASILVDGAPAPFAAALKTAACAPGVSGVLLERLSDATRAGLSSAITTAERGAFVCPGVTAEAQPFEIQYPTALTQPLAVSLNCNRDCLYLITLDRADGRPVVARRGQINGGPASPLTRLTLPRAKLAPGTYRFDVRVVARVNPGPVAPVPEHAADRRLALRAPNDLETPRVAGCEQRVGIDVVEPPDEVRLRIVLGRAVDGGPAGIQLPAEVVAALERCQALLDGAPFCVSLAHRESVLRCAFLEWAAVPDPIEG